MMKKRYFIYSSLLIISLISYSFSGSDLRYPSGAPAGYTGSPADGKNCTHCHGGTATTVENWITTNIPDSGYIPGQTYDITVTVQGSGKKGFEVSPQNFFGDLLGTLTAGSGSKLVGNNKYITHTSGMSSNPAVWTFQWTAPEEGTGNVVFYGAFAIRKSQTKLSSLLIPEDITNSIQEQSITRLKVYPDPVRDNFSTEYWLSNPGKVTEQLYSLDGKLVSTLLDESQPAGHHLFRTSIEQLPRGIYLVSLSYGGQHLVKKILVE